MHRFIALLCGLLLVTAVAAQDQKLVTRYLIDYDGDIYPQGSGKDTLGSVIKAIQQKKIGYLVAHLADPEWIDKRVKDVHGGNFDAMVKETTTKLSDDPETVKQLQHFLKDGEWEEADTAASVKVKDSKDRMFFRKVQSRWFLENRKKAVAEKAEK